jgi:Malectin domain
MKLKTVLLLLLMVGTGIAHAYTKTSELVNTFKLSDNLWRSKLMIWPERRFDYKKEKTFNGTDFFKLEYGRPCTFDKDWIKDEGYITNGSYQIKDNALILKGNKKGFLFGFGSANNQTNRPGIGFGNGWGKAVKNNYVLIMEIEQSVAKTDWVFSICYQPSKGNSARYKKFNISGKKNQTVEVELGWAAKFVNNTADGISFTCTTPNAEVKIKSMVIRPYTACSYWRKKVNLSEKPIFAKASYQVFENYDLYVNGKKVDVGTDNYPTGISKDLDLTPYLKKGENIIAMRNDFAGWGRWPIMPKWLFEAVAFDKNGKITRIVADNTWKVALKAGADFKNLNYDDSNWKTPKLTSNLPYFFKSYTLNRGEKIFTGTNPCFMGLLQPKPNTQKYPIFDYNRSVNYTLKLPIGLAVSQIPALEILSYPSGKKIGSVKAPAAKISGNWKVYNFNLSKLSPGPYNLKWTLNENNKILETNISECIVAGPIKQPTLPLDKLQAAFEKQLTLIRKIDCTREEKDPAKFLDHAGMYRKPKLNVGRISSDGKYRETGSTRYNYFSYAIDLKKYRGPVLIEVIIPDDKTRNIFSSVHEYYPIRYMNNIPGARRASCVATATAITGLDQPLSGKKRKLRYLYYPGSSIASVSVMNGFTGSRAAAYEINIYKITGPLPQVKAADNGRSIGPFTERPSNTSGTFGSQYNVMWNDMRARNNGMKDSWCMSYLIYADKIRLLRFLGQNFSAEGIYMYSGGDYASTKHNTYCRSNKNFDALSVALALYKHNNIKAQLAIQYMGSPYAIKKTPQISDRKMWLGEKSLSMVDHRGRQMKGRCGGAWNFLAPAVTSLFRDLLKEIYDLYKGNPAVSGFFIMSGYQTAPGFATGTVRDLDDFEVGYGDTTVSLFEKATGIDLGISTTGPERFAKRYKLLTTKYAKQWVEWRAQVLTNFIKDTQKTTPEWSYFVYPYQLNRGIQKNPFTSYVGTAKTRNNYINKRLRDGGYDPKLYNTDSKINLISKVLYFNHFRSHKDRYAYLYAWNNCKAMRELCKLTKSLFWASTKSFFIEIDLPSTKAKGWIWKCTSRGVYMPRRVGKNMMASLVDILAKVEVNTIYTMWLDCNFDTNVNPAARRFAVEYRAIPQGNYKAFQGFTNGNARIAEVNGKKILRLTNNTPYKVTGILKVDAKQVRNLAYFKTLKAIKKNTYKLELHPQELLTLELTGVSGLISGALQLPAENAQKVKSIGDTILKTPALRAKITKYYQQAITKFMKNKDYFSLFVLLKDYEMINLMKMVKRSQIAMANQNVFLKELKKGKGRIICGSDKDYIDPKGNIWVKDQIYTASGAYGSLNTHFFDRGNIEIKNTDIAKVYQTESYGGHVYYKIPVPNGKYTVYLHFAETYKGNNGPHLRMFSVRIQGRRLRKKVDPFSLAGGFATAAVVERKNINVTNGLLNIEMIGGVAINGIEVKKEDK